MSRLLMFPPVGTTGWVDGGCSKGPANWVCGGGELRSLGRLVWVRDRMLATRQVISHRATICQPRNEMGLRDFLNLPIIKAIVEREAKPGARPLPSLFRAQAMLTWRCRIP